jgi:Fur family ferric uptake transcriptional regulator
MNEHWLFSRKRIMLPREDIVSEQSNVEWVKTTLAEFMRAAGKKNTRQRDVIVDVFLEADDHLTLQELLVLVQVTEPNTGFATVYRTMKMLVEAGVAKERHFGADQALYELVHQGEHHDHLICSRCGHIFEYEDEVIEARQEEIAKAFGMRITGHRHELYGEPLHDGPCKHEV